MPEYRCDSAKPQSRTTMPTVRCDRDAHHAGPHRNGSLCWDDAAPHATLQDIALRQWAVDQVFRWADTFENGDESDDDDLEPWVPMTPQVVVEHARTFEDYVRGEL